MISHKDKRVTFTKEIVPVVLSSLPLTSDAGRKGIELLDSISVHDLREVCFKDRLFVTGEDKLAKSIFGKFSINVCERACSEFTDFLGRCFYVNAKCDGDVENVCSGSQLECELLPEQLQTLHQKNFEFLNVKHGDQISMHKLIEITRGKGINSEKTTVNGLYFVLSMALRMDELLSDENVNRKKFLPRAESCGLVCEGANIMLIRLLAKTSDLFEEETTFEFQCLDAELNICRMQYKVQSINTPSSPNQVRQNDHNCGGFCIIEHRLFSTLSVAGPEAWIYHLDRAGKLHYWKQLGSPVAMRCLDCEKYGISHSKEGIEYSDTIVQQTPTKTAFIQTPLEEKKDLASLLKIQRIEETRVEPIKSPSPPTALSIHNKEAKESKAAVAKETDRPKSNSPLISSPDLTTSSSATISSGASEPEVISENKKSPPALIPTANEANQPQKLGTGAYENRNGVNASQELKNLAAEQCHDYIAEHPELKRLLHEFLLSILSDKPDDVRKYAISYFQNNLK